MKRGEEVDLVGLHARDEMLDAGRILDRVAGRPADAEHVVAEGPEVRGEQRAVLASATDDDRLRHRGGCSSIRGSGNTSWPPPATYSRSRSMMVGRKCHGRTRK